MMKYSAGLIVCGLVLLVAANICSAAEDGENSGPVVVGFNMLRCAGHKQKRCASLSVRMSAESFDLLGRPDKVKWSYTVNDVKVCKFYYGSTIPFCKYIKLNRTVMADFVYDQENNEYFLVKRGGSFFKGVGFRLNSVCLTRGKGSDYAESCEKVSIVANESGKDYVTREVGFSPLVREGAELEVERLYIPVFMPFLFYQMTDTYREPAYLTGFEFLCTSIQEGR